jgi:regulator of sirC expression with transglutaminase-like and TPR domain
MFRLLIGLFLLSLAPVPARAADPSPAVKEKTVEQLAESLRPSVVVITVRGREGKREGLGTGFVVGADGLIATNLHVIGEGRPISVEVADGKRHDVTAIHAVDRKLDLAIVRIDAQGLTPLPLGNSDTLKDGQAVVAMGNPQGLKYSVVAGVVSGRREIDGRPMIQLAIPIEPGNSGGPLVDQQGRVHGILTIKSLVTANLGFAVPSNALQPLLKKPNLVPMKAWLTIGALDSEDWQPVFGGQWRQRAGRIIGEGSGGGFGNRALCLSRRTPPEVPFEVAVTVRLDDETGAAGLALHADGSDKHYGFYPSNGQLRFTRFDGPDVFSWTVLKQEASPHYRPGEWNTLKVRIEKDRFRCYVNDQLAFEVKDAAFSSGRVGLARFRETVAEFTRFRAGKELLPTTPSAEVVRRVGKTIEGLPPAPLPRSEVVEKLAPDGPASLTVLRERARQLELQAAQLRQLALAVHQQNVLAELERVLTGKEEDIDLLHAALLIARLDNDEVDLEAYRGEVERMARALIAKLPKDADEKVKLAALKRYLFTERGFHGSRGDYYNRSNSYLSEVIDDREGLPITLSVLYIELARRLGVNVVGVGLPGHFVVRHVPARGEGQLIDVYEGGVPLSKEDAAKKVEDITGEPLREAQLAPVRKRAVIVRMFHNLLRVAQGERDTTAALRYLDAIVALSPDAAQERAMRAGLRWQKGDKEGTLKDVDWLLEHHPEGIDFERLRDLRRSLTRPEK